MVRVLLVEDDPEKLRHVFAALDKAPDCGDQNIDVAHTAMEAKQKLRNNAYDLLILDIALPDRADDVPSAQGGITLFEEVLNRDVYIKPREVVGLTAFSDVRDQVGPRFAEDLWDVILYDPSSTAWAEQLQRKIRYIQMASQPGVVAEYETDLCLVTALSSPELVAVLDLPWDWSSFEIPGEGTVFKKGRFRTAGRERKVIAAAAPRMGMTACSVLASKMIRYFRPRYLAMIGIAAGVRGACELGDILAADPVWDWGSGKWYREDGSPVFAAAPHQLAVNSYIKGKLVEFAQDAETFDEIRRSWRGPKPNTVLQLRIGPVASGASVLADVSKIEEIKAQHRKLVGIDMELYGLFGAADDAPVPSPKAFALKSACDFADDHKDDDLQSYAAYTSARALQIFMEKYLGNP
jgi:nucleoside phosphorylase